MSFRVLAIDPGERIGWAHGTIHHLDEAGEASNELEITGHGISFLKDFALRLHAAAPEYDAIVYETWRLRPALARQFAGNDFPSVQFIGMVRLCAWLSPQTKLVSQGPSIKSTADRWIAARLPQVQSILDGLPKNHDDAHDGDALRHLAFYFMDKHT